MKKELINLSEFLRRNKLTKEADKIDILTKMAAPLPPGEEVEMSGQRHINLEGPEYMSESEVGQNLKLKDIFLRRKDDSFISGFEFLHFFRGDSRQAAEFISKFSDSPNPTEMSVVGTRDGVCKAMNNQHFGGNGYVFVMTGEPVSAFYFDASSSVGEGFMDSDGYRRKLKDLGVNTDVYLPKVINVSEGKIHSFFYDEASYGEASGGRKSDYHEFILRNAKVEYMVIDNKMRLDKIHEELIGDLTDLHYNDKIRLCSGGIIHSATDAINKLEASSKSFVYYGGQYDPRVYWNAEKFENLIQTLDKNDKEYYRDLTTLNMAIEDTIDDRFPEIENIDGFMSSIIDMARETPAPAAVGEPLEGYRERQRRQVQAAVSSSIQRIVDKNMDDVNSISYKEDNFEKLLFSKGFLQKEYRVGDITFETLFRKGVEVFRERLSLFGFISEDNIEDLSFELDKLYNFLYSTSYTERFTDPVRFQGWQSAKEEYLALLDEVMGLPGVQVELAELIRIYKAAKEGIPYSFIEERSISMGELVEGPLPESQAIVLKSLSKL